MGKREYLMDTYTENYKVRRFLRVRERGTRLRGGAYLRRSAYIVDHRHHTPDSARSEAIQSSSSFC